MFLVIVQFIRSNYFVFSQLIFSDFFLLCVNLCLWFSIVFLLIFLSWWNKKCNIINRFSSFFVFFTKKIFIYNWNFYFIELYYVYTLDYYFLTIFLERCWIILVNFLFSKSTQHISVNPFGFNFDVIVSNLSISKRMSLYHFSCYKECHFRISM